MNRRQVIFAVGGSVALIGGGAAWRVTRVPQTAQRPWQLDEPVPDVRLDALRHAILAPNPHNRQPWLLRLDGGDAVVVSCDLARRLPATDPFDRQTVIGFGSFCELARIAASQRGYRVDIAPFPAGLPGDHLDSRPVARLRFTADRAVAQDPLAAFITARRSTKEVYESRPVAADRLDRLRALRSPAVMVGASNATALLADLAATAVDAFTTETSTSRTYLESVRLMRIGHAEIDARPDGIDLGGPLIEGLAAVGQIDRAQLADPKSAAFRQGLASQREIYGSFPAAVWLTTPGNSRVEQFAAGQAYVRVNLLATRLGLSMHPTSQSLQEFAEVASHNVRVHRLLGADGGQVQMLARLGYGPVAEPAPRWPLETHFA